MNIPQHIAIILDGNGRWAKKKGMPRNYGHTQGSKNVERICEDAYKMGVKYLTVYAFSTENWKRPQDEVDALMGLLRNYMKTCLKTAEKNRMKVRVLGDKTALDDESNKGVINSSNIVQAPNDKITSPSAKNISFFNCLGCFKYSSLNLRFKSTSS